MKYLIKFSYDGSKFNGFQRLNDGSGVQNKLENALRVINQGEVLIKGAGRTDCGVHANNQAAHFSLDVDIPSERLINAINSLVGDYIFVNECSLVDDEFHARHSVIKKRYIYKIYLGKYNPCMRDYYQFYNDLDISKMKECIEIFKGGHSFSNFVSGERDNYNSIIDDCYINVDGDYIELVFIGKSFYRYMVRHLVGAIVGVGRGKYSLELVKDVLDEKIKKELYVEIPNGLYLDDVYY